MKKLIALLLVLVMSVVLLTACDNGDPAPATTPAPADTTDTADDATEEPEAQEEPGTVLIGLSQSFTDEFNTNLLAVYQGLVSTMDGVELVAANAGGSTAQQLMDVENLIAQGVDVVILRPVEGDAAGTAISAVRNAGIYLIIDEVAVPEGSDFDARIVGEQLDHGRMLGEFLSGLIAAGELEEANIGYIAGSASAFALGRKNGFLETLPSTNFIAGGAEGFVLAEGWDAGLAQNIVEGWIAGGLIEEMTVIAAMNDELANGAIAALAGNFPDIIILGVDGSEIGQHNIRNGNMRATTFQDLRLSSSAAIQTAVSLARGEALQFDDAENRLINPRHFAVMTIENIDELLG